MSTSSDFKDCLFFCKIETTSTRLHTPSAERSISIGPGYVLRLRLASKRTVCPEGVVETNSSPPLHFTMAVCMATSRRTYIMAIEVLASRVKICTGLRFKSRRRASGGLSPVERRMTYVASRDKIDHVLGNVGGVIPDPFQVLRDQHEFEGGKYHRRVFHHVSEQFTKHLVAQAVHLIVALKHTLRQFLIAPNQGIQAVADHAIGQVAHARKVYVRLYLRMPENAHS